MRKLGKKTRAWLEAKERLIEEYKRAGITKCERCRGEFILSLHHLDKRSSGKATHTFEKTRLLCQNCHDCVETNKRENERLRAIR